MLKDIQNLIESGDHNKAISILKKQLKKKRNNPQLLNTLGCIYADAGDQKSAKNTFKKIISTHPEFDQAYFNLGLSYKVTGDFNNAIRCYKKAISLNPTSPTYYNNLGNALSQNNNYSEAVLAYQKSLTLDNADAKTYYNLGKAYSRSGLLNDSIEAYIKSLDIQPASHTKNNLANSYLSLGNIKNAKEIYQDIISSDPGFLDAIAGMIKVYDQEQNFTAAHELVKKHINSCLHAGMATAFARIAHKINKTEIAIEWLKSIISSNPPPDDLSACFYELGNIYDKQKQYDVAFYYYRQANSLVINTFDKNLHNSRINNLIKAFNYDAIDMLRNKLESGYSEVTPVFIVGMPRSGTSLLEKMLSGHSRISAAGELDNFNSLNDALFLSAKNVDDYENRLNNISKYQLDDFRQKYIETLTSHADNAVFVTDKMPNNYINVGLISGLFPESYIIHIKRNSIDTCLSCYFQNFSGNLPFTYDLDNLCHVYKCYENIMNHWSNVVSDRIINITYEELIQDPEGILKNLTDKLGIAWESACLEFYKSDKVTATASYDQVRQPIYTSSRNRWKHYKEHITPLISCLSANQVVYNQ